MPRASRSAPSPPVSRDRFRLDDGWKFHRGDLPFTGFFGSILKWDWKPAGPSRPKGDSPTALEAWSSDVSGWSEIASDVDVYGLNAKWTGTEPGPLLMDRKAGWVWFRAVLPAMPFAPKLHFTCVRENADVFLNGRRLYSNERWIHPFDVDLSKGWRKDGPNTLLLLVEGDPWGCSVGPAEWEKPDAAPEGPALPLFDDSPWTWVNVPHDFVVEGAFDRKADVSHGYLPRDVGWYRRSFDIPESDRGRRLRLDFDGVFRNARVWLNGRFLGRHTGGYTPFGFDITPAVLFGGTNQLSVRVDARGAEGWWYEGGGLYRQPPT